MSGPVIGVIAVVVFLVLLIGLPIAFVVWSRRAGEDDWTELYRGLKVYNLPAPDLVEVNLRINYGLIAPVRVRYAQVFTSPQDARRLLQRVQTLNLKRGRHPPRLPLALAGFLPALPARAPVRRSAGAEDPRHAAPALRPEFPLRRHDVILGRFAQRTTTLLSAVDFPCPRCGQRPCNVYEICWTSSMVRGLPLFRKQEKTYALQCLSCRLERDLNRADADRLLLRPWPAPTNS